MRSSSGAGALGSGEYDPSEDLTARARIRDAAISKFAAEGFGVGVRAIAAAADVSPGLVMHHFGSKEGLRDACDKRVLALIHRARADALNSPDQLPSIMALAADPHYAWLAAYLFRSLQAGGAFARRIVTDLIVDTRDSLEAGVSSGMIRPSRDPHGRADLLTRMSLGYLLLDYAVQPSPPDDLAQWILDGSSSGMLAGLEVFTEGLFTDSRLLDGYVAATAGAPSGPVTDAQPATDPPAGRPEGRARPTNGTATEEVNT